MLCALCAVDLAPKVLLARTVVLLIVRRCRPLRSVRSGTRQDSVTCTRFAVQVECVIRALTTKNVIVVFARTEVAEDRHVCAQQCSATS